MKIVYPEQRELLSISDDGTKATVRAGAAELRDDEGSLFGGFSYGVYETADVLSLLSREERRRISSFIKFRQVYDMAATESEKKAIAQKMLKRFKTTDLETFKKIVFKEAKADPRLEIKSKRTGQVIKTTVKTQQKFNQVWRNADAARLDYLL